MRDGRLQNYALSVNGGGEALQYFVSGNWIDSNGVLPHDEDAQGRHARQLRLHSAGKPALTWNNAFNTRGHPEHALTATTRTALTLNAFRRGRDYFGDGDPDVVRPGARYDSTTTINHFISGRHGELRARRTLGRTASRSATTWPRRRTGTCGLSASWRRRTGIISDQRFQASTLTFEYAGNYRLDLSSALTTTLSFGGQSIDHRENNLAARGNDLPGPGEPT